MAVSMELLKIKEKDDSIFQPAMTTLIYPVLQMANYLLPSRQQNAQFMFYNGLVPKFWLAYIGYVLVVTVCRSGCFLNFQMQFFCNFTYLLDCLFTFLL